MGQMMMSDEDLLRVCAARMEEELDGLQSSALRLFWKREHARTRVLAGQILEKPVAVWEDAILEHRSHRHPFYETLASEVTVREYATFFLENAAFPSFDRMVERTEAAQITEEGRAACRRNLDDEQVPVPHKRLMRRLMDAFKTRAGEGLILESYPSLIDRTLVFYYGHYCDPWHLVGALFAMEAMAHHRLTLMKRGLDRLGFAAEEIEFVRVHLYCDEHHARDWRDNVILPTLSKAEHLRVSIAEGIAGVLETSARYLDDLERRVRRGRSARQGGLQRHWPAPR